jgi:hypothetical protein
MGRSAEYGPRLYANLGLKQTWKVGERWFLDLSLDRTFTYGAPDSVRLFPAVPPASGGTEDVTAVSAGTAYYGEGWQWNLRGEFLGGERVDRWSVLPAIYVEPREGLGLAAGGKMFLSRGTRDLSHADVRLGLSWRRSPRGWTVLDRLDLVFDEEFGASAFRNRRVVNNLNLNRRFPGAQLALQYGSKYVSADLAGSRPSGYTDLTGLEARFDLGERWDVGAFGSLLRSWNGNRYDYRTGVSLGWNPVRDLWAQAGYNVAGYEDTDFAAGAYTAHGPFVRLTLRLEEDALALLGLGYRKQEAGDR